MPLAAIEARCVLLSWAVRMRVACSSNWPARSVCWAAFSAWAAFSSAICAWKRSCDF
jgi:hypothetical protein